MRLGPMAHSLRLGLILLLTTPNEASDPGFVQGILKKQARLRSGVGK